VFDTHCHLNFKAFRKNLNEVIDRAMTDGVNYFVVPGTDLETSKRAVKIAEKYGSYSPERCRGIYAAVGIHPHHVYQTQNYNSKLKSIIQELEKLITHPKVVAVGEIGLDRHQYKITKYKSYLVDNEFVKVQKELLIEQIKLAVRYKKAIILHNRESTKELLNILTTNYYRLTTNMVFHCCEPDDELFDFAIKHKIFIGVDGDVTYSQKKQAFVKKVPLELLVLETDSPYLIPKPLKNRSAFGWYRNEPKNLNIIAEFIARKKNISISRLIETTYNNSKKLFSIND